MNKPIKAREYNLPQTKRDALFEKPLKFTKEYLPLIVLVPAILGGLWQIIALASMSIAYIRFFSVTQLIADGFLAILVILPWLVYVYIYIVLSEEFHEGFTEAKKNVSKLKFYLLKIALALFHLLLMAGSIYFLRSIEVHNDLINYLTIVTILFLILFVLDVFFFNSGFVQFLNRVSKNKYLKMPFIFSFIMIFFIVLPMFFDFKFYLPRNLENLKKLEKYNPDKNAKLRYFNDKYIFIEHKKEDNSTTIQVVPFEELF